MATTLATPRTAVFPAAEVEARIRDSLAHQATDQAVLRPSRPISPGTIDSPSWEPEIDSLVAVEVICAVEEFLGIRLPATFTPKGGYDSVGACVNDLISEAKVAWTEMTKEKQTNDQ
jgi:acyl carrier protein